MANSQRRILDRNGNQFIPMNVEGQNYSDSFWSTTKVVTLALIILGYAGIIAFLSSHQSDLGAWLIFLSGYSLIALYLFRYIIFEEKFYYKMYKELLGNEVTTPAIFWNIASIKNTEDGAILTYADAKVGVLVKLDRDTITGKPLDFEETHYDAISDFYKDLTTLGYSFVQLNIMEMAGKDPRLVELDKVVTKCDNENIRKLVELQVGHIKNIAQNSLYESDYILIYTHDITKIDNIISDVIETMFTILNGAYIGFRILNQRDLIDLEKESFGIKYFNSTDASLNIYKNELGSSNMPFNITGIVWDDGEEQILDNQRKNRLRNITTSIIREVLAPENANIKGQIYAKNENKENNGIDFTKLSQVPTNNTRNRLNIPRPNINIPRPGIHNNQQVNNQQVNNIQNNYNMNNSNNQYYNNNESEDTQLYFNDDLLEEDDDIVDI